MKTKIVLIAAAAILATGIYLHDSHPPSADGKCPRITALPAKK